METTDSHKIRKSIQNSQPSRKGDVLAEKLEPYIGTTREIRVTCALICRYSTKLHRLAEEACNGPDWMNGSDYHIGSVWNRYKAAGGVFPVADDMTDEVTALHTEALRLQVRHSDRMDRWQTELEAMEQLTEDKLRWLVEFLPCPTDPETGLTGDAWTLDAESDPRGCSVIQGPDFVRGDSWGDNHGICVPNR